MRKHVKEIGKFFVFVAIFFALTSPFVFLFGPFDNLKRTVVGAILKSRHPQYITWLFSQEEIDKILGGISSTPKQELFKFKARTDSTLTLKNIDSSRFKGFLLEIPDPHRVQVATAENMDEKGDTTSGIAERVGAVAAINAGGFYDPNGQGNGSIPDSLVVVNGEVYYAANGERNGFVGFDSNYIMHVGMPTLSEIQEKSIMTGACFGPVLVANGEPADPSTLASGVNPRTAIGQRSDGAVNACNLDGGSSSLMWFGDGYVNNCASVIGIRPVPTTFLVLKEGASTNG